MSYVEKAKEKLASPTNLAAMAGIVIFAVTVLICAISLFPANLPEDKFVEAQKKVRVHVLDKVWWYPGYTPVTATPVDDSDFERRYYISNALFKQYGMGSLLANDEAYQCRIIHYHRVGIGEWVLRPINKKVTEYETDDISLFEPAGVYETIFLKHLPNSAGETIE